MSVLIFILILSFLVIIHELGHFLTARWQGMRVEEFGFGYPPRALTLWRDKRGTVFSLNWLPFGGFVRLFGEEGLPAGEEGETETAEAFSNYSAWRRLLVIGAGAVMNFCLGVVAFGVIYSKVGIPTDLESVRIDQVVMGSPAEVAGLKAGSVVTALEIQGLSQEIKTSEAFIQAVAGHKGETVILELADGTKYPVYVRMADETPENEGAMGVVVTDFEMRHYPWWQMPFRGMAVGLQAALEFGRMLIVAMGQMVVDLVAKGEVPKDVAGPVGIAYAAQKDKLLTEGWLMRLNFAAILSINLAIVNVLPIPALDGGRAVFVVWEMITKRKVKPKVEQWVNAVGFSFLLGLIVMVSIRDIRTVLTDKAVIEWFSRLVER